MDCDVCIIGAGPSGLMAAIQCAAGDAGTSVVEGNTVAGRKLLLTGGGRCNITHDCPVADFVRAFGEGGRFLSYCLHEFPPERLLQFFAERGLGSVAEADGSIFPSTGRASDVRDILLAEAKRLGADIFYGRTVVGVGRAGGRFDVRTDKEVIHSRRLVIATGGLSYPVTGSKGDGYRFAEALGHTIEPLRASLTRLVVRGDFCSNLAGTPVGHAVISSGSRKQKAIAAGPLVFTGDGVGGPAVQDISRFLTDCLPAHDAPIPVSIDFFPDASREDFERRLLEGISAGPRKAVAGILADSVARRLAGALCDFAGAGHVVGSQLTKDMRRRLVESVKALSLPVVATGSITDATVTRGGVRRSEIDPKTMESRICRGLFFAGEVIDVDGPCGGYNLQGCFSSGAVAGESAAREL